MAVTQRPQDKLRTPKPLKKPPRFTAPWPLNLYQTAIGKKWVMAVTGLGLIGFVVAHMIGNMHLYEGPVEVHEYAEGLRDLGGALIPRTYILWAMRVGLLGMFVLHIHSAVTLTTISFPEFFLAYILIVLLASFFPTLANVTVDMDLGDRLYKIALPTLTMTLVIVAHMMRMTRAAIINLLASPYIEMAQLKGVSKAGVILKHALPNAWAPIATVIAFNLAYLVVGVVVVEVVFVYPGIGQLMVDAVSSRDIPVAQGCAMIFAATYILLNLLADIIGIVTNPRLLHPR